MLGWIVLVLGAGAAIALVARRASAHGILAAVAVGFGVRLAVMLIANGGSSALGDHGFFYVDDQTLLHGGTLLSDQWRAGRFMNPSRYDELGTYQFGYQLFLAVVFTLGTPSLLLGKLANVLLGGITVYVVARIAGRILGERAQFRTAWLLALAPSLVWWSAPLMKEALATLLLSVGVLSIIDLPRRRAVATLALAIGVLAIVRTTGALALVVAVVVAIAVAGRQARGRWLSPPLGVLVGGTLGGGLVVALVMSGGDLPALYAQYHFTIGNMFHLYQGGNVARVPYDAVKSLVTPLPWVFDRGTRNWDRGLYPGMWLLLCAYPLAAAGLWRLRRRPEAAALLAAILAVVLGNAFTAGFVFRQRSMIEPLFLTLAVAGAASWRTVGRSAGATLGVVAVVAGAQSGSPVTALAIAVPAVALLALTRRLPALPYEPLPLSRMVEALRPAHGGEVHPRSASSRFARNVRSARGLLLSVAPSLDEPAPPAPGTAPSVFERAERALEALDTALLPHGRGPDAETSTAAPERSSAEGDPS